MKFRYKNLRINGRLYYWLGVGVALFCLAFLFEWLYVPAKWYLGALGLLSVADWILLFAGGGYVRMERSTAERLSNGDENDIFLQVASRYPLPVRMHLIDELPAQFQKRDFGLDARFATGEQKTFRYGVRPVLRGVYGFGNTNAYVITPLGLLCRRFTGSNALEVKCYPSYIQLRRFELMATGSRFAQAGLKKVRRIGNATQFEQIKSYVQGDNIRHINWKATAKEASLMVNQYQDEKSQPVYSVIDKGRLMQMPFDGLTLLDYALNSTLVLSNAILKKYDKAGMFTFSRTMDNVIVASRRSIQLNLILDALYNIETDFAESDFGRLYAEVKTKLNHRSLIVLYTNFETLDSMKRQMKYLKAISAKHLLVVVFFKNALLEQMACSKAATLRQVYEKLVAEKFMYDKKLIVRKLQAAGIHTVYTTPANLTADTLNKYLEIKARGLI